MKRLFLISCLLCFAATTAQAQKVSKEGSMFVIECVGMPAGSYTKVAKPRHTNGSNTGMGSNVGTNLSSEVSNRTVAYKFEVAAADNATSVNWLAAVNKCSGLAGGNWRIPTQRELYLICIEHEKLKALPGFTELIGQIGASGFRYWCATENSSNESWTMHFSSGEMLHSNKVGTNFITRCVRDIVVP